MRATDGSGAFANIAVTITVTDFNENPKVSGPAAVTYAERDTVAVGTYTADDPENAAVTWSVDGTDEGFFNISPDGVLTFKTPPDFEAMGSKTDEDENNMYEVMVVATDDVEKTGTRDVSVTLTDVDDPGSISFGNIVQPGFGVPITAKVNDQDSADMAASTASYQWARGDSANGPFTDIENATNAMYTPTRDDENKYLQVTAEYGAEGNRKTVSGGFDHHVEPEDVANQVPVFPDQDPVKKDSQTDQEREVAENSAEGTPVGAPVVATDDDVLSYRIEDFDGTGRNDATYFKINKVTGQISVSEDGAAKGRLDYENTDGTADDVRNLYVLKVIATDANAAMEEVKVTIIVTDVNEKPTVSAPSQAADEFIAPERQKVIDADGTVGDPVLAATFTVSDPETDPTPAVTWSVEGIDGDKFTIVEGTLAFKSNPDFEAEASASGTNTYKVTIVATDPEGNRGTRDARVTVDNVDETGSVELSTVQPQIDKTIKATLSDPDGIVGTPVWTWSIGGTAVTGQNKDSLKVPATINDATTAGQDLTVSVTYDDKLTDEDDATDIRTVCFRRLSKDHVIHL